MSIAPDPITALRTIIGLDAGVLALVPAARVFGGELPEKESAAQPRAAVLIQPAGGFGENGYAQIARPRVDVKCYATTPHEGYILSATVHDALKQLQRKVAAAGAGGTKALVHSATPVGGPNSFREPDGQWPFTMRTYELLVAEVAAP